MSANEINQLEEYRADTLEFATTHGGVSYRALCVAPELRSGRDTTSRWGPLLKRLGADRVYVPSAGFMSGTIVEPCALEDTITELPPGVSLYQSPGCPSDGTSIMPRQAMGVRTGGCAILVMTGHGICIAAHGGRWSVLNAADFGAISHEREHSGLIENLAAFVLSHTYSLKDFRIDVLFALPKEEFGHPLEHPVHGEVNEALWLYLHSYGTEVAEVRNDVLYIDLGELIVAQAYEAGFGYAKSVLNLTPRHASTRHANSVMRDLRNDVFVVRTA